MKPRKENELFEHQIFLVAWEKNRTLWRLGHPRAENANPSTHEDEKYEPFAAQEPKNVNPSAPKDGKCEPFGARG